MPIDAREIELGQVLRADVCIIGPALPSHAAHELADSSLDVLVLESGGSSAMPPRPS
jgi:hypothetical protein